MEFSVEETREGILLRPVKLFPETRLEDVIGCIPYKGRPKSIKDMEKGIAMAVRERHARGRY
jgi:hypothetical protein